MGRRIGGYHTPKWQLTRGPVIRIYDADRGMQAEKHGKERSCKERRISPEPCPHETRKRGSRRSAAPFQTEGVADYFVSSFSGRMTTFTSLPSSSTFLAMACTSALVSVWSVCS